MKPDKAILEQLYITQGLSLKTVGQHFNVCAETVRAWLKKEGISTRPPLSHDLWNARKQEITFLYHTMNLSQGQIARYFNTIQSTIYKVMKRLDIPRKSRGRRKGPSHYHYKNGQHNREYRKLVVKDQCSQCGTTDKLCIHHKNDDHYDNRLENLEILCHSCHMSHTKKAWWAAKKAGLPTPKSNGPVGWTRN